VDFEGVRGGRDKNDQYMSTWNEERNRMSLFPK
jgi:hypothetical protein